METLATFFIVLAVYAVVILLAGAAAFLIVWAIHIIIDRRKQKQIFKNWRDNP